jgi:small subunit ribosomal protein S2
MNDNDDQTTKDSAQSDTPLSPVEPSRVFNYGINIDDMTNAGLHFGHRTSNYHPKMMPYIQTIRNSVRIINLNKTGEKLEEAIRYIQALVKEKKSLVIIGTKIQHKELTKAFAVDCGFSYVENRWLGGTFTNIETIKKRILNLKDLIAKKESGELVKYTKKEQAQFGKEIHRMETLFGGLRLMDKLPDAIFVLDMKKEAGAVKEARKMGVKIIAICDANVDPTLADYPIPANDDAVSSVKYILDKIKEEVLKAKN